MSIGIFDFGIYSPLELVLALVVVCAAGTVRGFTGFGTGLVMVPLLALMWGPVEALGTTVILGTISTLQLLPTVIRRINWREMAPMLTTSVLFSPVGTALLISLDKEIVKKVIAALVLGVTLITLRGWKYAGPRGAVPSAVAGALGGTINGVAGVGGPPMVLYLLSLPDEAETHRANIVVALALSSLSVFVSMLVAGVISTRILTHGATFVLPTLASVSLGAWLFRRLPAALFKLVVLWFLIAISLAILLA
ncbi:MAG: sulfite exporter TauE/SafE family protein [Hyphomicrobiaceae bacterium]